MTLIQKNFLNSNSIKVCFCIDENYVCQLGAVLYSLVETNNHNRVDIYVISSQVSEVAKLRLTDVVKAVDNFSITFVDSKDKEVQSLEAGGHISAATYMRFEVPVLLSELDKVLYLDADLIIADDLGEFWNVDISRSFVGAVENPFFDRYISLGMTHDMGYFNAGVLLMNLTLWREKSIKEQALNFLVSNKIQCLMFDQDALNAVFKGEWTPVNLRWNLQTSYLRGRSRLPRLSSEIKSAYEQPGIVHYSSSSKPWNWLDAHPLRYLYKKNARIFGEAKIHTSLFGHIRAVFKYMYLKAIFFYQTF